MGTIRRPPPERRGSPRPRRRRVRRIRRRPSEGLGVYALIDTEWQAFEADLLAVYGLRAREIVYGPNRYGARELIALVVGLPATGAVHRAVLGDTWTTEIELHARTVDLLGILVSDHRLKKQPDLVHRPALLTASPANKVASVSEAATFFKTTGG